MTKSSSHLVLVSVGKRGSPFLGQRGGGGLRHRSPPRGPGPPAFPKQDGGPKAWRAAQPGQADTQPAASAPRGPGPGVSCRVSNLHPAACPAFLFPHQNPQKRAQGYHLPRPNPAQREEKTFLEQSQTGRSLADQGVLCLQQGGRQTGLSPVQGRAQRRPERRWARPWHPSPSFLSAGLVLRGCKGHSFVLRSWPR